MREYKPPPFFCTCAWECSGAHSHAFHSGARDFPELHVYSRNPYCLAKLGFYFGRFLMRFVEVACVSTSLHPSFAHVPRSAVRLALMHATPAPVISRKCTSFPEVPSV